MYKEFVANLECIYLEVIYNDNIVKVGDQIIEELHKVIEEGKEEEIRLFYNDKTECFTTANEDFVRGFNNKHGNIFRAYNSYNLC